MSHSLSQKTNIEIGVTRFGQQTVIAEIARQRNGEGVLIGGRKVKVRCDCGDEREVLLGWLTNPKRPINSCKPCAMQIRAKTMDIGKIRKANREARAAAVRIKALPPNLCCAAAAMLRAAN